MTPRPAVLLGLALGAALAVAALAAACAGSTGVTERGGSGAASSTEPPPASSQPPRPAASPAALAGDDGARVLSVAMNDPSTLDPMRISDPGSLLIARQLFEGLTRWDPEKEEVAPAAASSWKVQDGGTRYVFQLRDGMTFHNGTPVTSQDFKFAFDRIALRENTSDLAYTLGRVKGFSATNQLGTTGGLGGVTAPDDSTLVIELTEPFEEFPAVLTHPGLVPLPSVEVADLDGFLSEPVGNGPFRLAQPWSPGSQVVLDSFEDFYDPPDIDGMRMIPFPDSAVSWIRFLNEDIDVAEVPAGEIDAAKDDYGDRGFKPLLATYNFGMDLRSPQLQSYRLRMAISQAIDREAIAREVFEGLLLPPRGVVPQGMPGFSANVCFSLCRYRPRAAGRVVAELPEQSRRVELEYTQGQPHRRVARAVKRDLEAVGLDVSVRAFPFPQYLRLLRAGDQNVYRLGWIAEYPSPDAFLDPLFAAGSPDNHSGFDSSFVDDLLREAQSEPSAARRLRLYRGVEKRVIAQAPIAPIGTFATYWAAQPRVSDIGFDVMGGFDGQFVTLGPGASNE